MKVALPFPKCPKCETESSLSYHKDCGGKLRIETSTDEVYCDKCDHHWNIWESNYYCSCGHTFSAEQVHNTLTSVLVFCRVAAEELSAQDSARQQRLKYSKSSMRKFFEGFFQQLGYSFGIAIGTIVESVLSLFFK
ncbi:MAG: hypothetical protein ACOX04_04205 [Candidatus Scatomorpha sp.]